MSEIESRSPSLCPSGLAIILLLKPENIGSQGVNGVINQNPCSLVGIVDGWDVRDPSATTKGEIADSSQFRDIGDLLLVRTVNVEECLRLRLPAAQLKYLRPLFGNA